MKKQGGFTLIELVVVIVILGILAVTAAPRFLNLQDDARSSAVKGLKGAMQGAAGIVYGKAAIAGVESSVSASLDVGTGSKITVVYGYPEATAGSIGKVVTGLDNGDWTQVSGATGIGYGFSNKLTDCHVTYQNATSVAAPTITVSTTCK
ncbi:type II secretion system protein [Vibrio genomosp. F6]|uniref:MSHA biogenesis protein MshA n=1 Tax=Vibrio genomosp. F6 str. FF-238 TaxID=1191298 RepID=A0A1E5D865_9VIBR|nr:prepilin-type N-terminal cleavage/methylation domain-containing protein [Vibrio genomosp. F6]OEE79894.1 MSHA biogenesis protein MshA [Vibrio genomosp. F6 str. FF-238]